ncbi:MAG: FAD-dependent oxidoreductase, partial [Gemmatimonadaceae bacterium]
MSSRVIVLGGGVAGMSAAHELIERGFEVIVLERRDIAGGKARSIPVADDGKGTSGHMLVDTGVASIEHHLPGEHGFRFFPGFYKHVIDTMRRIPSFDGRKVADHLVPTTRVGITQYGKPTFIIPAVFPRTPGDAGTVLRDILLAFGPITDLTPDDLAFFGARIWQILTSCEQRRLNEYEKLNWWEFVGAEQRSASYQKFLAAGITRSLVAAKARKASTRTIGDVFVQLMLTIVNPLAGSTDRVFDGPTNLVWIDPWRSYLESRGVQYRVNAKVEEILCAGGRVTGVAVRENGVRTVVNGDYYVAAVPLERMAPMVNASMLAADPSLANLRVLAPNVEWMTGVQYYLRRDVPTAHGHVIHIDSEWALTSISQLQFWRSETPEQFGDSDVRGILSVDISDWTAPGSDGRPAIQCSREDVMRETWKQLKRSINIEQELLRDEDLHSWFLDPDIRDDAAHPGYLRNTEPLLVNLVGTWPLRPHARTGIPNLFLASDYVRTYTDLATMEGANEAARRAVNGLLDAAQFDGRRCDLWPLHEFDVLVPWRLHDAARYEAGLPWDDSLMQVAAHAIRGASPVLDLARPLLEAVAPFATPVADVLDLSDSLVKGMSDVRSVDPTVKRGSAYVPTPQYGLLDLADAVPGAGDLVGPAGFMDRLGWYRDMLTDTLASGVPTGEPQKHLYGLVKDFIDRSGKGLRPALCIATARALGARAEDAFPAAAGIEMLHNAFLVHDDIEDGSDSRRGEATMHRRAGVPIAVNTGDAMNALAMRFFRRSGERLGPEVALRILDEVDHMLVESLEGQATELGWVRDNDLTVGADDYLRLVLKKTAWYSFIHPMRIGALVANGSDANLDRFDRFGYLLG